LNKAELMQHGVAYLIYKLKLTGNGLSVGIWDGGMVLSSHVEFQRVER
jgi:hypothetical protein